MEELVTVSEQPQRHSTHVSDRDGVEWRSSHRDICRTIILYGINVEGEHIVPIGEMETPIWKGRTAGQNDEGQIGKGGDRRGERIENMDGIL